MTGSVAPTVNDLNRPFWEAAARDRLALPHCIDTARAFWPPSPISPFTSGRVEWREVEVSGTVLSLTVYRRIFQKAFAEIMPFGIALVALDAGPRFQAHVPDPDGAAAPAVGARVVIGFRSILTDGFALPIATAI